MSDGLKRGRHYRPDCSKFTGYKPCEPYKRCDECDEPDIRAERILLVGLEALGAVLMTTALLPSIKRKYPQSYLIWLTRKNATPLLQNNPYIDEVMVWEDEDHRTVLKGMEFETVYSMDKLRQSCAFVNGLRAKGKVGFGLSPEGAIIPLNQGAHDLYMLGLDDELKFKKNELTGIELMHRAAELEQAESGYVLCLAPEEKEHARRWASEAGIGEGDVVVGFNTGCSHLFPNKKLSVEQHVDLIGSLLERDPSLKVALLGGREDTERNLQIYERTKGRVINTPTTEGLRRGTVYMDIPDVVVSGDSLGMHMAIGLRKYVVAWFGLSCAQEIDLFGRGEKIISGLDCAPCWKKHCDDIRCVEEISKDVIRDAALKGVEAIRAQERAE
jgi:ADP-heptose:LPS heptosyltransferase